MSSGLEEAALAFETVIDPSPSRQEGRSSKPVERMFERVGEAEVDEDSPEAGGGDDVDDEEEQEDAGDGRETPIGDDDEGDDGAEGDSEDAGDEDDDGDDEGDGEVDFTQKFEVTVDGKPQEVTLKEALGGYIRTQTFHQRMGALENARKVISQEATKVVEQRDKYAQLCEQMEKELDALVHEPDWDALFREDPAKARELQKQYDQVRTVRAKLADEKAKAKQENQEYSADELRNYATGEFHKFVAAIPSIKSREDLGKELSSMKRTALSVGFSEEEISTTYDSRMLLVLQKASKYDRMMAARPKAVKRGAKHMTPGSKTPQKGNAPKGMARANKRLSRSGSIDDAAAVFAKLL